MNIFHLNDTVAFRDEFGKWQIGVIVNLKPAGFASNGVGINLASSYGTYIRQPEEIKLIN